MKNFKHVLSVLGILFLGIFLHACEEGAFEEAGEKIDAIGAACQAEQQGQEQSRLQVQLSSQDRYPG